MTTISRSPADDRHLLLHRERLGALDRRDEADNRIVAVGSRPRRPRPNCAPASSMSILVESGAWFLKKQLERGLPDGSKKMWAAVMICRLDRKSAPVPTEGVGRKQPT